MLVHRRVTSKINFAGSFLHTYIFGWTEALWAQRIFLAQEHNTTEVPGQGSNQDRTARSGDKRTKHTYTWNKAYTGIYNSRGICVHTEHQISYLLSNWPK